MKRIGVVFCFLLTASACGGTSDSDDLTWLRAENEMLKSQTTMTVLPAETTSPKVSSVAIFSKTDSEEFFDWCVAHRMNSSSDLWQCGEITDLIEVDVNEKGLIKDCTINLVKRAIINPPEPTEFTSGRDDWVRYPLPAEVNVRIGTECRNASEPPDPVESPVDIFEAVACSNLSLDERKAGVRVFKYYEIQAFVLIDRAIAPGSFMDLYPSEEPVIDVDASYLSRQLDEATNLVCPEQSETVAAFSEWLISLEPEHP